MNDTFPNARDCEHGHQRGKCVECELAEYQRTEPLKIAERNQLRDELALITAERDVHLLARQTYCDECDRLLAAKNKAVAALKKCMDSMRSSTWVTANHDDLLADYLPKLIIELEKVT